MIRSIAHDQPQKNFKYLWLDLRKRFRTAAKRDCGKDLGEMPWSLKNPSSQSGFLDDLGQAMESSHEAPLRIWKLDSIRSNTWRSLLK